MNRELLRDIITQEVGYYMLKIKESATNIYGEAAEKYYDGPTLLQCLVTRQDQEWSVGDFGVDVSRNLKFAFLRDDLTDLQLVPKVGDIVLYLDNYFAVDSVIENQLFVGKDPSYPYSQGLGEFGTSLSIICETHLMPADKVQISQER